MVTGGSHIQQQTLLFLTGVIKLLPVVNISSEKLARYLTNKLIAACPRDVGLLLIDTTVERLEGKESPTPRNLSTTGKPFAKSAALRAHSVCSLFW